MDHDDPELLEELLGVVRTVAEQGAFIGGSHVEDFEADFAAYCEAGEAVGISSGTEALVLSLRALGIGPGDEVIVPANSFIATAEAVSLVGATPRLVDVDPATGLITADIVAGRADAPRSRCVIPVHLYGATVDMDPILERRAPTPASPSWRTPARRTAPTTAGAASGRSATWAASASTRPRTSAPGATAGPSSPRGRSWPSACACCARTASARATATAWWAPRRAWMRCRRRSCA